MPRTEYIVQTTAEGGELSEHIRMVLDARATVRHAKDTFDRIQEHRLRDRLESEARDRVLRGVVAELGNVRHHLHTRNYGLADEAITALRRRITECNGPSDALQETLEPMLRQAGLLS